MALIKISWKSFDRIELNSSEDRSVPNKQLWDNALGFTETDVRERLIQTEKIFGELKGPGAKELWLQWKASIEIHVKRQAAQQELQKLLHKDSVNDSFLFFNLGETGIGLIFFHIAFRITN